MGSRSGVKVGGVVKVVVKVRGQCHGVKVRVMIGGHKVGQGRWSRSGYRSWGQVGGGVKVGGSGRGSRSGGSRSGEGSRFGGSRSGSRSGAKVVGSRSGS